MALEGWVGWHGQGKTYCAVAHCLTEWDRHDIPVWSNATLTGCTVFETWDELMALIEDAIVNHKRAICLIDEAGKWLSSRFFNKLDPRVLTVLQERRKVGAGLDMYWTAPNFSHVDKILRDVTQVVHSCKRFGGSEYSHDGGRAPKVFWQRSYRPTDFSEGALKRNAKPLKRRLIPFTPALASLYTTGLVNMGKPNSEEVQKRPDHYGDADRQPPAVAPKTSVVVDARPKR